MKTLGFAISYDENAEEVVRIVPVCEWDDLLPLQKCDIYAEIAEEMNCKIAEVYEGMKSGSKPKSKANIVRIK